MTLKRQIDEVEIKGVVILFRRNILIALILAFIGCFIHTETASAESQLEVKAEVGVSNKIKYFTPLPLKITVTNNGSSFSGDLVIDAAESYATGSATVYPLDIAEGETKTVEVYLNGLSDDYMYMNNQQQASMFYFYEGGIEKGKLVSYTGTKNVRPQYHEQEATFIYTLTENSDRLSAFLRLRQYATYNVEVFHLNQIKNFEFPTDPKGLSLANILAVDEVSVADLSDEQQQAILRWIEQGGTLLVGASDQVDASMGLFNQYLPLTLSQERVVVPKEQLKTLSNGGIFTQNIEVYRAEEKEESIRLLADGDTILASQAKLGNGRIIQTTFSLGDQPLAGMDGYGKLLSELFKLQSPPMNMQYRNYIGNYNDYLPYEVGSINELFPSFQVSGTALIVVIIIYILVIGPILYFILRKVDKREHAWWIIPAISIVLSLCLFIFGAKDRLMQSQIQQAAFYKVNEDSSLSGHYVESILTNRGGDFTFTTDGNTTAVASRNVSYGMFGGGPVGGKLYEKSYVKQHADGSTIHLQNLDYWSVQSIVGQTYIPNAGNMDIQLTLKDGLIKGTIKNNFPFKLHDVTIWSGSREIKLGDLESNGTLNVSEKVKNSVLLAPAITNMVYNTPQKKEDLLPMRLEKLKYGATSLVQGERLPAVVAWTDEALVGIELDGNAKNSPASYLIQTFKAKVELNGEFTLDKDVLQEVVEPTGARGYMELLNESINEWYLEQGEYDYYVTIPSELLKEEYKWTEIEVSNKDKNRIQMAMWNSKSQQYEELKDTKVTFTSDLEQYISTDGQVKIKLTFTDNQMGTPVKLPYVEIKGVTK